MKGIFAGALLLWGVCPWVGWAQTAPIYINNSPVYAPPNLPPQIDATAFVNRSIFSVNTSSLFQPRPFETLNTRYFTNTSSGTMFGNPGFRFNYATSDNLQAPMNWWVNDGSIDVESSTFFFFTGANANWLLVDSDNIVSSRSLSVGSQGLLRLRGQNINLARSGLRSGQGETNTGFFFGSSVLSTYYINDVGITDVYWGTGTNNVLDAQAGPMDLTGIGFGNSLDSSLPFPQSPFHEVIEDFGINGGGTFITFASVPSFFGFGDAYTASVFTNQLGPTNFSIQVVYTPTNFLDTNFSTEVRFYPEFFDGGATVVVGFHNADYDVVDQRPFTNSIYLVDALAYEGTNSFLATNLVTNTQRPNTYDVTRNEPFFGTYTSSNAPFSDTLVYNPATYLSNRVEVIYTGYQANVSPVNVPLFIPPDSPLNNPTNYPGRIEILGDKLNLERTRIRADTTLIMRTDNLTSNKFAAVDAPFMIYDIGSTQPTLVVSNLAPRTVRRISGPISAWSGTWRNYEAAGAVTNAIDFHVLIVESGLQGVQPVIIEEFRLQATNAVISDTLNLGQAMKLEVPNLHVQGGITMPAGSSWAATNVVNIVNFTNSGIISIPGAGVFGADRALPYGSIVNSGTLAASSHFLSARYFENPGCLVANNGPLLVRALEGNLLGKPTILFTNVFTNIFFGTTNIVTTVVTNSSGAKLAGNSDVELYFDKLSLSNSVVEAGINLPGAIILSVTNTLVDAGPSGINQWKSTSGFNVVRKPLVSDLLSTHMTSVVPQFSESLHIWPADDRGVSNDGYDNNLALGRLILDGQGSLSQFAFAGTGPNRALYVDYIEFQNYATNFNEAVRIFPSLTIYFAGANVPVEKLDGTSNGRFRWVSSFAGPATTTNITYPSGTTYPFNIFLTLSQDLDSDYDGIVNSEDPTPFFVPELTDLNISVSDGPLRNVLLSWNSIAFSTNHVLMKTNLDKSLPWHSMTSCVNGSVNGRMEYLDQVPSSAGERYYKIRIDLK